MASMKLKTLEHSLQDVEGFDNPKISLEQYTTTPHLSACILHSIQSTYGDIEGKLVADLGCGCGILSIGSLLLGSAFTVGFDIDTDALEIFTSNIEDYELLNYELIACDVTNGISPKWESFFDTVVMNPPFGTRNKGVDVEFIKAGLKLANVVYSLYKTSTREYFFKKSKEWNVNCKVVAELKFDLPNTYKFHSKKSVDIFVDVLRFYR
uniref:Methyltransferase-like protein 5 n=1 Tax=Lygus hesperus TaxID=30085 RepID=A0A0K8T4N6_LYGHE